MSDSRPAGQKRGCGSSEDDTTLRENERAKRLCMLEDDITDPEVKAAGDQAVKDGSLAPLTKNMLKTKIKHRRLQEGKPELPDDDLFKPPPTYELTSEEKRKIRERKERNRKAAHKSRMNRKMRSHDLQKENKELQARNQRLKDEVEKLRKAATEHVYDCQSFSH
nr:hypothetical protein BaRGS_027321 [Batillaria attramentaria]